MQILIISHIKLRTVEIKIVCLVSANMPIYFQVGTRPVCVERGRIYREHCSVEFLQNLIYSRCKTNMYFEVCASTKEINFFFFRYFCLLEKHLRQNLQCFPKSHKY